MTLRKKVLLIVSATIVALVVILHVASQIILLRGVAKLEEQVAGQNVQRAVNALTDELDTLNATAGDWAAWDDTYNFVENANDDYIESNLADSTFANLRLNLMLFVNSSGQVVLARGFNLSDEREIPLANSLVEEMLQSNGLLLHHSDPHSSITGVVMLSEGPMLVASRPIVASGYEGPIRGTLIMGRYLDSAEVSRLSEKAHLSISLSQFSDVQVGRSYLSDETPLVVRPLNAESVAGYFLLKDVYGNPALVLKVDMPRDIYKQGAGSVSYFMWALLAFGLVFGVVVLLLLEKVVLSRLARLDAVVSDIAASGDLSERVAIRGSDELSSLAGAINRMLEGLEQSRAALQESEEKYRDLVERANDGIIIVQDGLLKYVNPCLAEMSGYPVEELTDTPFTDYVDPDELPKLVDFYERRMAGERGVIPVYETKLRHRDGSGIEVELNAGTIAYQGRPADLVFVRDVTGRRRVEKALRDSEARFRELFDNMSSGVAVYEARENGHDFVFADFNRVAERIDGIKKEDLLGKSVLEVFPGVREFGLFDVFQRVWRTGKPEYHPVSMYEDGRISGWRENYVYKLPSGELVAVYDDVTERQQAEGQLRKLSRAVEQSPSSIVITDTTGAIEYVNPKFTEITGYAPEEVIGRNPRILKSGRQSPEFYKELWDTITAGREWRGEFCNRKKNGEIYWESASISPITNAEGVITHFVAVKEDITERKQAEREIEERRQYLEVVLEAAPDAIITLDAQYQVVEWNSGAEKLFGYIRDEVIGRNLDPLVTNPDTVEEAVGFTQTVMNGEDLLPVEAVRYRKDGSPVDVILAGSPILVGSEPVGAVAVYTDITERKRVEEEGRKAKEAAEAAAQAKSDFLANMSHEIRTPLNAVIGMTGLLLDTELTAEQLDFVETVRTSGETLLTIINDILDFSKIEAGKLGLEQQPFDLRECIEVSLDLVTSRATEKGLNLAYLIEDNTPGTLVGDVTRLRQILVNLLSNAVKFTNSGEVVVSVTSRPLPLLSSPPLAGGTEGRPLAGGTEGAYEVHFTVRDTGIGIPQDSIERLFQSFSQVDVSTTRRYGGTGLGLAISKRLAEMMGGTMWVESEVGKGSTFHFTVVAEAAAGRESECSCSPEPQLAGKRILIVDDNETNQQILTRQTESWGMLPRAAGSGSEALDWVRRGDPFDVAILDMQMPEMDGLTLAAEIRKHGDMQSLPLVMLTSMGQREEAAQSVEFAAYLTKPVKSSQLCDVLMGIFAGRTNRVRKPEAQSQFDSQMGHRHPLHILLAEDNVVNQKVALRILERMGYRADLAANGLEVLEALDRQHYDVVLMDVQMPEMDGEEATRQIHKRWPDGDGRRPRIVAMTAHSLSGDRERYLGMGMDDYISKPVRVEELTAALERCQPHAHDGRTVGSSLAPDAVSRPTTAAIDPVDLERFREMMGEAGTELIALFLEETLDLLAELREAVAKGDAESLQRVAHTLKGSSATLGAMRLSDLCKELEIMGRRGALEGAAEKVAQVETEYERVRVTLE